MKIKVIVADNVRGFRHKLDVSQEKLAELADIHRNYVGYIERGERNVTLESIAKIAKAFKIKPHILLIENAYKFSPEEIKRLQP